MQNDKEREVTSAADDVASAEETHTVALTTTFLKTLATTVATATHDLMKVECIDIAARGRVVATLAEIQDQLGARLGIKKRKTTVFALNDLAFDVFTFLSRKELDMLQVVNTRFNDLILRKMTLACLRRLSSADIVPSAQDLKFHLVFEETGLEKETRLPTGVDYVDGLGKAFPLLVNACRSAVVERLEFYYASLNLELLDSIVRHGPTIVLDTFVTEKWKLCVSHERLLQALQSFVELRCVHVVTSGDSANLWNFLFRNCFKINSSYIGSGRNLVDGWWDAATATERLLEFSFGPCEDRYATRERIFRLRLKFLPPDFLKTWIQKAETVDCRHKLTLEVTVIDVAQELGGLEVHERRNGSTDTLFLPSPSEAVGIRRHCSFESVSGRRWTAAYEETEINFYEHMHLFINHDPTHPRPLCASEFCSLS